MNTLSDIIFRRLIAIDFSQPLAYVDILVAFILVTSFLFYMRRFPIFRMMLGAVFLWALSFILSLSGLTFTALIFGITSSIVLISLPLVFAPEIRHYLEKLGRFYYFRRPSLFKKKKNENFARNLADAVLDLARKKIGALIILERKTPLGNLLESGVKIDAIFGSKILENIFYPNTPLHDGAVVISEGRIVAARCTVPISPRLKLDPPLGLRHKAGLSATWETDAVALIVSEQRGEVSLAENSKLESNLSHPSLVERLQQLL